MSAAFWSDFHLIRLLKAYPFERRQRGGWRFGTKRIGNDVVARLIASGRARIDGERVIYCRSKPDDSQCPHSPRRVPPIVRRPGLA